MTNKQIGIRLSEKQFEDLRDAEIETGLSKEALVRWAIYRICYEIKENKLSLYRQ